MNGYLDEAVALLAEGVDRNSSTPLPRRPIFVALLAEGVDRNLQNFDSATADTRSPSSRRAWIEIIMARLKKRKDGVALLAEGVDRNRNCLPEGELATRRPPRGGRG